MAAKSASVQFQPVERPPVAQHESRVLDLAFCMDCTGSMGSYIHSAQQNIRQIVEEIVANEKSDIHLALIEYRDHPPQDSSFVTRVHDFTPSVKNMKTWLEAASASGGGDFPEAVADAWQALLKLNWREEATKICVHIADAPPHGLGVSGDSFPKGCPDGLDPVVIMNQLAEKGVTLYMVGCEPSVSSCRSFYMAMAHITGGQYVPLNNARLLTKVIIGGAEEEMSLEALMAEVQAQVDQEEQESAACGVTLTEEDLAHKVQSKLNSKGVQSRQLWRNKEALPETTAVAQAMAKCSNLDMLAVEYKKENTDRVEQMCSAPRKKSNGLFSGFFGRSSRMEASDTPSMNAAAMSDALEDYTVESAPINMMQAQRMVQKAKKRSSNIS